MSVLGRFHNITETVHVQTKKMVILSLHFILMYNLHTFLALIPFVQQSNCDAILEGCYGFPRKAFCIP